MFLNPLLLIGLSAVAVPILIHLLNRRKHRRVVWAAMRFLVAAIQKNQKRMTLEDLILLALRCLVVALLALAMARPTVQGVGGWFGRSQVTAVLVLDNSYSMSQSDGTASRYDLARRDIAGQILGALPGGSSAAVVLGSDVAQDLIPQPTYDLNFARQRLSQAPISDRASDLLPALQRAVAILEAHPGAEKEIYLLTDGQASAWRQMTAIQALLQEKKQQIRAHLVFIGDGPTENLGVSVLRMAGALAPTNRPLRFDVEVTNYGRAEAQAVPVKLVLDEGAPAEETTLDRIAPGASRSVSLFARIPTEGFHAVTARIPRDRLGRDDQRTLMVHAIRQVQVLLVDGRPDREARESETFYMRRALQPVDESVRDQYFIQTRTVSPAELEGTRLDEYDVICLANVADLSPGALRALQRAVREGRGLIVLPGDQSNLAFYNQQMGAGAGLLPATLGPAEGDAQQADKFWTYQSKDFGHPITALWNDPAAGNMAAVRTYRRFDLTLPRSSQKPGAAAEPALSTVVLNYSDGKAAIVEQACGLGRVLLFAGPASTAGSWNDLAVRPKVFLPLVHRIVGAMLSRQDDYLNIPVGRKWIWRVGEDLLGRDAMIARPGQDQKLQDSRKIERVGGYPTLGYDQADQAGVYTVSIAGEAGESLKFAAQADAHESLLEPLSAQQMDSLSAQASVLRWTPSATLEQDLSKQRVGTELWPYFAALAVALAAVETVLAYRFSQVK